MLQLIDMKEINEFGCYEVKSEKEKAGSCSESKPGHLWLQPPLLCHWTTTARQPPTLTTTNPHNHQPSQPPTLTILFIYCTGGTKCLSCTPGSQSVCAVRTPLGVDRKILSDRKAPMLSGFLTLNAQRILHYFLAWSKMVWAFRVRTTTQHKFFPDGESFPTTPKRVLTAHTEWLLGVQLRHLVPPVQYIKRIVRVGGCEGWWLWGLVVVRVGGCPAVVVQWQSSGSSTKRCPGFNSRLYFRLITSKFDIYIVIVSSLL